ncbi:MAG: hypothetical protein UX13_C0034G0007 [Candidatus Woesebacteria bacterium GW2011_GWB1_45_5]|uniref:Uncharacterized protein n=1 Tax=Candidatus Woesebacteria bacterium GW2011_GWB1_45_5 TaxID=1618581 RepID=A0A0G1QLZ9_9BACT|nr:MAG: hypothetical protein UX13_C0034G0007 [Candidatus Woesebacteria bacterium GW2011_GWB1_45_5]
MSAENPRYPEVRFIQIYHESENAYNVWKEARKADVILLEFVGDSKLKREFKENYINFVSGLKRDWQKQLMRQPISDKYDFFDIFMRNIIDSGKEVRYIDFAGDSKIAKKVKVVDDNFEKALSLFWSGCFDLAYEKHKAAILENTLLLRIRDPYVAGQIRELIDSNTSRWQEKKIAVIQGAYHAETYRIFKRENPRIPSSRTFMADRFVFGLEYEAGLRLLRGNGDIEGLIKRDFISNYLIYKLGRPEKAKLESFVLREKVVRAMTDAEVESVFEELAAVQKEHLRIGGPESGLSHIKIEPIVRSIIDRHKNLFIEYPRS